MNKILLTGGGTAGHVIPNIALLPKLEKMGFSIVYIGSKEGMEKDLIKACNIPYHGISAGKLRRYFNMKNFTDALRVVKGLGDALSVLKKEKPDIVFSKGGFVTVPVVLAAKMKKIPVIIHESDITPGLANKISLPFATAVCVTFPETVKAIPKKKSYLTGTPIRSELFAGNKEKGLKFCGFTGDKPVLLIMGGSLGAQRINECLFKTYEKLTEKFNIVHIVGKGNLSNISHSSYKQFEFVSKELPHIFAATDIIVSRAGANAISEFLALKKPNLLIPLPLSASRGDQILNAASFEKQGFSRVLPEENMTPGSLLFEVSQLWENRQAYIQAMENSDIKDSVAEVCRIINEHCVSKKKRNKHENL